jgi:excisionase family DNA binding protein
MVARANALLKKRGTPRLPIAKVKDRNLSAGRKTAPLASPSARPASAAELAGTNHPPGAPTSDFAKPTQPALPGASPALDLRTEKVVTVKDAAYLLGKSEDTIYHWLKTHRLGGWQPGGRRCAVLISEASVIAALSCTLR